MWYLMADGLDHLARDDAVELSSVSLREDPAEHKPLIT
jgi:hypothetical protein